jgi:hypothetical protein
LEASWKLEAEANEQKLAQVLKLLEESATEKKSMSKANLEFTQPLLQALGFSWTCQPTSRKAGKNFIFDWAGGEEARTDAALQYFTELLGVSKFKVKTDTRSVEILKVNHNDLILLKGGSKEAKGKTDLIIRFNEPIHNDYAKFGFSIGSVELKTDKCLLNFFQLLLESVAMSYMSEYKQGIVLLGTDLNDKWEIMYFDKPNHISHEAFEYGTVAMARLKELLQTLHKRLADLDALSSISQTQLQLGRVRTEQDLEGFDLRQAMTDKQQAVQDFALFLREKYNANVTLPIWARSAEDTGMYG